MPTQQPAYRAFTVVKREGQDDYWLPIGAAFPHQNGDGLMLSCKRSRSPTATASARSSCVPPRATTTISNRRNALTRITNPALDAGSRPPQRRGRLKSLRAILGAFFYFEGQAYPQLTLPSLN